MPLNLFSGHCSEEQHDQADCTYDQANGLKPDRKETNAICFREPKEGPASYADRGQHGARGRYAQILADLVDAVSIRNRRFQMRARKSFYTWDTQACSKDRIRERRAAAAPWCRS